MVVTKCEKNSSMIRKVVQKWDTGSILMVCILKMFTFSKDHGNNFQ